jgi:ribosomal protein S21
MIEVKKSAGESDASLIRRFSKRLGESKNLVKARSLRFKNRPKSQTKKKEEAIKKAAYKKKIDHLRKLGKIK